MSLPRGDGDWFLGSADDPDDDLDDDRNSTFAVVIGSVGALVVAAAMTVAIVFAFGEDDADPTALVPQPGSAESGSSSGDAATAPASPTAAPPESSPTSTPTATPTPTGDGAPLAGFVSPSGNIGCVISASSARCDIGRYDYEPPAAPECPDTWGDAVAVGSAGSQWVCHRGAPDPGANVLDYGQELTEGEFTCSSAESGVTCRHDPSGASFRISRADVELTGESLR